MDFEWCQKRGAFDNVVLEQLVGAFWKHLKAIPSAEAEQLAVEEADARRQVALDDFKEARVQQQRSAHSLRLAELQLRHAQSQGEGEQEQSKAGLV